MMGMATDSRSLVSDLESHRIAERAFGQPLALMDAATGDMLHAPAMPVRDWAVLGELCRAVARRRQADVVQEDAPLVVLGMPLGEWNETELVAAGTFLSRPVEAEEIGALAAALDVDPSELRNWVAGQEVWTPGALLRQAELVQSLLQAHGRVRALECESHELSDHLATTFEEISLLHRLTRNLKLSQSDEDLGRVALEWMLEVLPAESVFIQLLPIAEAAKSLDHVVRTRSTLLSAGDALLDNERFTRLVAHVEPARSNRPLVINRSVTAEADWPFPEVRELTIVPMAEGENLFGWIAAVNHSDDGEFGTVEASLIGSVGVILGIHSGNVELYRQQSELLAGVVRALTSAIDAKDPYTCGHSDRVARIAVRLAQQLGWDNRSLNNIYLSGLLHDIGKIGVNDAVLRKPGKLSEDEYQHIKRHVQIGHRILVDLRKLDGVLPVVLHHHEAWDGGGYPSRLAADAIPQAARIVSVADSYDAMASDRPYRLGLPEEKIEAIFRAGAGQQWDPEVIEAFFAARDDIRAIVARDASTE